MKKINLAIMGLAFISLGAFAIPGYVTDKDGHIWRDYSGECWKTRDWTPNLAIKSCSSKMLSSSAKEEAKKETAHEAAPIFRSSNDLSGNAHFAVGKAYLSPSDKKELTKIAQQMKSENKKIVVKGYTDRTGSESLNQKLSLLRAEQTKDYLVSQGAPSDLIEVKAMGSSSPLSGSSCDAKVGAELSQCLQQDRRIEIFNK